jgi:hypothetical protein
MVGFGPGEPMRPQTPAEPIRRADYPVSQNMLTMPRAAENRSVTYDQMRSLADMNGVLRTVIEKRKDELKGLDWSISVRPDYSEQGYEVEAEALTKWWEKPDGDTTFDQWLGAYLEDVFVIDAPCLYKNKNRLGQITALEIVDGSTILVLINDKGRVPNPPQMAYEQVVKGMPRTGWTKEQMVYRPYNLRSSGVYGFSHVESIILTVNIALRRDASFLEWFKSGNIPQALAQAPESWNAGQILKFQEMFDTWLSGDLAARSKLHWIPGGGGQVQVLNQLSFDALFDEWLARIICARFGVSPVPYVRMMNRNTAESAQEAAREESLVPLMQYCKAIFDSIIADDMGKPYLQFLWREGWQYTKEKADIAVQQLEKGIITIDDVRRERGNAPLPNGVGAKNLVWTGGGPVPLEDIISGKYQAGAIGNTDTGNYDSLPRLTESDGEGYEEEGSAQDYELYIRAVKAELDAWERFAINRLGKKSVREFEPKVISQEMAKSLSSKITDAGTAENIKAVFDNARRNLSRRRTPVDDKPITELANDYQKVLAESMAKAKSKAVA